MKKIIALISSAIITIGANCCFAELYEYEDSSGVLHFTDDPSKVPLKSRKKLKPSLTTQEQSMIEYMNPSGREVVIPAKDLEKSKKLLNDFYEINKENVGDLKQEPDYRLSTPERAIDTFINALQNGSKQELRASSWIYNELETAKTSELIELGNKMASCIKRVISKDNKTAIFELKENSNAPNRMIRTIKLIYLHGNWKISIL